MSDIAVSKLAEMVKAPVDVLMRQLKRAGIEVSHPDDKITDAQKLMLLQRMREGDGEKPVAGGKKITLKSRGAAAGAKKGGVEVRRKKTLSLRKDKDHVSSAPPSDPEADARAEELARKAEQERQERERLIQKAERERRELEASRLRGEVAGNKNDAVAETDTGTSVAATEPETAATTREQATLAVTTAEKPVATE
ncbi:MAG: translation initiation factor IF-2, partial [Thiothrix nivea]